MEAPLPVVYVAPKGSQTAIVQHMQATAREFGIVDALLEHQRIVFAQPARAQDIVESVLLALGVTNGELLENLEKGDKA